jgi:hypothetical protein
LSICEKSANEEFAPPIADTGVTATTAIKTHIIESSQKITLKDG